MRALFKAERHTIELSSSPKLEDTKSDKVILVIIYGTN